MIIILTLYGILAFILFVMFAGIATFVISLSMEFFISRECDFIGAIVLLTQIGMAVISALLILQWILFPFLRLTS